MGVLNGSSKLIELRQKYLNELYGSVKRDINRRIPDCYKLSIGYRSSVRPCVEALHDPNPLAVSSVRPGGLNTWDQVLYLPGTFDRIVPVKDALPMCPLNECWNKFTFPRLRMLRGVIGEGEIDKVNDEFIYDWRDECAMEYWWFFHEAAHTLAHMRAGDCKKDMLHVYAEFGHSGGHLGPYVDHYLQAFCELLMSLKYNIGLDLRGYAGLGKRQSTMQYGVEVVPTVFLRAPKLLVERSYVERLQYDGVGAIVLIACATGSPPLRFKYETECEGPLDALAGRPNFAAFAGWCTPDMLFHGPVASPAPDSDKVPNYATLHVDDLLPMDTFPAYLDLAAQSGLFTKSNQEFVHANAWMNSEDWQREFMQTPPWPCGECMHINSRESSKLNRPKKYPRTLRELQDNPEWKSYREAKQRLIKETTRAVKLLESRLYSTPEQAAEVRKRRGTGNKHRLAQLADKRMHKDILERSREGKDFTRKQSAFLRQQQSSPT